MHGANMKIIFITFTLFKTSRHARSKLCPEHCVAQAKAGVELCCPALPLNSRWRIQTCGSQKPALLCPAWAALPASQCALGLIQSNTTLVCCVRLNKCGLFSDKYNGMASIKIAFRSRHFSIMQCKNQKRKVLDCSSNIRNVFRNIVLVECNQLSWRKRVLCEAE